MKNLTPQTLLLAAVMLAFLTGAVWMAVDAWTSMDATAGGGGQIGPHGILALVIGAIGTFVVGVGLMALVFYSSRNNFDR